MATWLLAKVFLIDAHLSIFGLEGYGLHVIFDFLILYLLHSCYWWFGLFRRSGLILLQIGDEVFLHELGGGVIHVCGTLGIFDVASFSPPLYVLPSSLFSLDGKCRL